MNTLIRRCHLFSLSSHPRSIYNIISVSVRRNFSVTSRISSVGQGNQRTTSPNPLLAPFRRYIKGEYAEPYGDKGKESRDLFIQTLTKTFTSVAEELCHVESIDASKPINTHNFLEHFFTKLTINVLQQFLTFPGKSVHTSYLHWVSNFWASYWQTLNTYSFERTSQTSMFQDLTDRIAKFLNDYSDNNIDQIELKTRIDEIVGHLLYCMEEHLSGLVSQQGLEKETSPAWMIGLQDTVRSDLQVADWQDAWNQPFRGDSLNLLKRKLALNVNALQRAPKPLPEMGVISKLDMSRIIPIVQSSGTGKSRLAEEYSFLVYYLMLRYVRDQFAAMLSLKNGQGFPNRVLLSLILLLMKG